MGGQWTYVPPLGGKLGTIISPDKAVNWLFSSRSGMCVSTRMKNGRGNIQSIRTSHLSQLYTSSEHEQSWQKGVKPRRAKESAKP